MTNLAQKGLVSLLLTESKVSFAGSWNFFLKLANRLETEKAGISSLWVGCPKGS